MFISARFLVSSSLCRRPGSFGDSAKGHSGNRKQSQKSDSREPEAGEGARVPGLPLSWPGVTARRSPADGKHDRSALQRVSRRRPAAPSPWATRLVSAAPRWSRTVRSCLSLREKRHRPAGFREAPGGCSRRSPPGGALGPRTARASALGGTGPKQKGEKLSPAEFARGGFRAAAARVARSFLSLPGGTFIASGSELTRIWKTAKSHQPVCVPRTRCVAAARVRTWKKD